MNIAYFYTLLEVQYNGTVAIAPPAVYWNKEDAESACYLALSYAAKSQLPYHAVHLIRSDGEITMGRVYDRRVEQIVNGTDEQNGEGGEE